MIKFIDETSEKRYRVIEVAKATGLSEGAVSGYFSNRKISTRNGLNLQQIVEVCKSRRRGDVRWGTVDEIRNLLNLRYGIEIIEKDEEDDQTRLDV